MCWYCWPQNYKITFHITANNWTLARTTYICIVQHVNKASKCPTELHEVSHCLTVVLNTNLLNPKNLWLFLQVSSDRLTKFRRFPGEQLLEQNSCILQHTLRQGREVGRAANNLKTGPLSIIILTLALHNKTWFQNYLGLVAGLFTMCRAKEDEPCQLIFTSLLCIFWYNQESWVGFYLRRSFPVICSPWGISDEPFSYLRGFGVLRWGTEH